MFKFNQKRIVDVKMLGTAVIFLETIKMYNEREMALLNS